MLEPVNKIYFKKSDYDDIEEMFEAVYVQQLALARNNYMCLLYKSPIDNNVFVLEFASLDPTFNQEKLLPCWITPEEAASIAYDRLDKFRENAEEVVKDALKLSDDDSNDNGGNHDA